MSIGNNIKNIRKQKRLTQKQLADIAGVTDKAVSMWEQDRRDPRMGAIQRIADYFGISKSDIIEEPPISYDNNAQPNIPIVERVSANGEFSFAADTKGYDISYINLLHPTNCIYFWVGDDSMAPTIAKGDLLHIIMESAASSGELVLVSINGGDGVIRRVILEDDGLSLVSDNPYFPKITFNDKNTPNVKIWGIVKKMERFFEY